MRILKETEATGYLERLNSTFSKLDNTPPFSYLRAVLQIELSYFQKLIRDEATKDLAVLAVSSTGFPELPSLAVDIEKAYEGLGSIEANIGDSVYPLLRSLELSKDLAAFDIGAEQVAEDFNKDQQHIDLLKELREKFQLLYIGIPKLPKIMDEKLPNSARADNISPYICTDERRTGLLFYGTEGNFKQLENNYWSPVGWSYQRGFLKYIDSVKSKPMMIVSSETVFKAPKWEKIVKTSLLKTIPDSSKVLKVLNPLSEAFREDLLSTDFTTLPDESLDQFITSSAKMGSLLEHIKGRQGLVSASVSVETSEQKPQKRGWWRLGR